VFQIHPEIGSPESNSTAFRFGSIQAIPLDETEYAVRQQRAAWCAVPMALRLRLADYERNGWLTVADLGDYLKVLTRSRVPSGHSTLTHPLIAVAEAADATPFTCRAHQHPKRRGPCYCSKPYSNPARLRSSRAL
jgi:hypothetical protein